MRANLALKLLLSCYHILSLSAGDSHDGSIKSAESGISIKDWNVQRSEQILLQNGDSEHAVDKRDIPQSTKRLKERNFFGGLQQNSQIGGSSFECPKPYGKFFIPDNCKDYAVCRAGVAKKKSCPDGLLYNKLTSLCDYPHVAKCPDKCPQANGLFPLIDGCEKYLSCKDWNAVVKKCPDGMHFNALMGRCDTIANSRCSVECPQNETLLPLPGRCGFYVHCFQGIAISKSCPPGLHFNPAHKVCDDPENARCQVTCPEENGDFPVWGVCDSYISCTNGNPKLNSCPKGLHYNFLLRQCETPERASCNLVCPEPTGFFPVPGICSAFIKCIKSIPELQFCPVPLHFNPIRKQCDLPSRAQCRPKCKSNFGRHPIVGSCDHYLECFWSQTTVRRCPKGLNFNPLFKDCENNTFTPCTPKCRHANGNFPIPGLCEGFLHCKNGKAKIQHCPQNLHYNARTMTCDWPKNAQCELICQSPQDLLPIQGDCTRYAECSTGKPIVFNCSEGMHFDMKTGLCETPLNAGCQPRCPEENGFFPYDGYCDAYIQCFNGHPRLLSCPPGLYYNAKERVCDYPQNSGCAFLKPQKPF